MNGWCTDLVLPGWGGRIHQPEVTTPGGRFIKLVPNTESGRAAGRWKVRSDSGFFQMKGRFAYHDP